MGTHRRRARRARTALGAVAVAAVATWGIVAGSQPTATSPGPAASLSAPAISSAGATLDQLRVAPDAPALGYDRDERFGRGWPSRGKGCDLRDEVLRRDLSAPTFKPGSTCDVAAGSLRGTTYSADQLDIDHVIPLKLAWDSGASNWTDDKRRVFATDLVELRAEPSSSNRGNGELGPERSDPGGNRCAYAVSYIDVAGRYGLTVTEQRKDALERLLTSC